MNNVQNSNVLIGEVFELSFFKFLTQKEILTVFDNLTEATFKPGEMLFKQGTPASHFVILTKGLAKIVIEGYVEKELILTISKSTRFLNGPGFYSTGRCDYSATALTAVSAVFIDGKVFKRLVLENGRFAEGFITEFSTRAAKTFQSIVNLTQQKMPGRMAWALLYLVDIFGSTTFDILLSKKEMGDLTGMTKESATRILNDFAADNLITLHDKIIEVLDIHKLKEISAHG